MLHISPFGSIWTSLHTMLYAIQTISCCRVKLSVVVTRTPAPVVFVSSKNKLDE